MERKLKINKFFRSLLALFVAIGGSVLTAILPLNKIFKLEWFIWVVWFLALFVNAAHIILDLFHVEEKYLLLRQTYSNLKSEGWRFLNLTDKYRRYKTQKKAYKYFCYRIQKMKRICDKQYLSIEVSSGQKGSHIIESRSSTSPQRSDSFEKESSSSSGSSDSVIIKIVREKGAP